MSQEVKNGCKDKNSVPLSDLSRIHRLELVELIDIADTGNKPAALIIRTCRVNIDTSALAFLVA